MEFECQEDNKFGSSKYLLNCVVHNTHKEQLGSLRLAKTRADGDSKRVGWKNKEEGCDKLVLRSDFGCDKVKGHSVGSVVTKLVNGDEGPGYGRSITDLPPALISEIFNCLDPKELGIVSCVSSSLYKIASDHSVWKEFYCERWGLPIAKTPSLGLADEKTWKELFVEREFRSRTFLGQYTPDFLSGHTEPVRTVFLLALAKLIFTAGYDSVIRIWDMEEGLSVASTRSLGCTIRAVTADTKLLAAGGDGFIQCWKSVDGVSHLFDLKGSHSNDSEFRLWEHEGPVTCLALDLTRMYSGSWDMTVRVWDRAFFTCILVLRHSDWVWNLAPHSNTVASTSGSDVYIWDARDGTLAAIIPYAHEGYTYALVRSHTGDFLFTGGEDGSIHMFNITNCAEDGVLKVATWMAHSGPVHSLAFEFPWLVSASSDGKLALIDVRKLLRFSHCSLKTPKSIYRATIEPPQRMLHGSGSSLFSVDIGADRIVCGGEERIVRMWDFSRALEKELRSRAQRVIRLENRMGQRRRQAKMNSMSGRADKCLAAAMKNPINGDRSSVWHNKRGVTGKVKA